MDEIAGINEITKLEVVKAKRSCRRGRITRLKTKLDKFLSQPLSSLNSKELKDCKEDLSREIKIHVALQNRYEILLQDKVLTETEIEEEENAAEDTKRISTEFLCVKPKHYEPSSHTTPKFS